MNKTKSQSGSAHLIIIIILSVALIGSLGFVFYQNYMQPKTNNEADVSSPVEEVPVDANEDPNTLAIADWEIDGVYNGEHEIDFKIVDVSSHQQAYFTSSDLSGACSNWQLVNINKYSGSDVVGSMGHVAIEPTSIADYYNSNPNAHTGADAFIKKIGENYYFYSVARTDTCATDDEANGAILTQVISDIHDYFLTLQAI